MVFKSVLLLVITSTFLTSATPFLYRYRRSLESSNDPEPVDDIKSQRQAKAIDFYTSSELAQNKEETNNQRQNKALSYFGFLPQYFSTDNDYEDDLAFDREDNLEENDLSRTLPSRKKNHYKDFSNTNALGFDNSPIYYIRLPPTPYMFVPGYGYISQPPSIGPPVAPPVNPFINLPIDFVSNGKPTGVYQWSGTPSFQTPSLGNYNPVFTRPSISRPQITIPNNYNYQKPSKKPISDTKITNLDKGPYVFNGKPTDIFVLRDSYNSLYSDALQNFYP